MSTSAAEQSFYNKLKFISSIPMNNKYDTRVLTNEDLYEVCQYIQPYMIQNDKFNLANRISAYRQPKFEDTCLHIASKASNIKLVTYLLQSNLVSANTLNKRKQTALSQLLTYNSDQKAQTIGYILAKKTDLSLRNQLGRKCYEVPQSKMNPPRARLLEYLKKLSAGK